MAAIGCGSVVLLQCGITVVHWCYHRGSLVLSQLSIGVITVVQWCYQSGSVGLSQWFSGDISAVHWCYYSDSLVLSQWFSGVIAGRHSVSAPNVAYTIDCFFISKCYRLSKKP